MKKIALFALLLASVGITEVRAEAIPLPDNTHLIERNEGTGFAIYRSSKPNLETDFIRLCTAGVTEIMVLDGTGEIDAALARRLCPQMRVVFDEEQAASVPLTEDFLNKFDRWVEDARVQGKKIAFRCNCGCHRTGRLAAYYRMKFQDWTPQAAILEMKQLGRVMFLFRFLDNQVLALHDFLRGRACSQLKQHCVTHTRN